MSKFQYRSETVHSAQENLTPSLEVYGKEGWDIFQVILDPEPVPAAEENQAMWHRRVFHLFMRRPAE